MRVHELIDILSDQPPDTEVEIAIVAPVDADKEDITVDRYFVDGVLPWQDAEDDEDSDNPGELTIWLVGGEEADVSDFLDAIEQPDA
ncbi:hypothetical protein [Ilumatobacter sp.]|uniref:hypothetical protein n=1 Tax=Ilumatobacter sp. TaxID=1967498 RepID=UPI0037510C19